MLVTWFNFSEKALCHIYMYIVEILCNHIFRRRYKQFPTAISLEQFCCFLLGDPKVTQISTKVQDKKLEIFVYIIWQFRKIIKEQISQNKLSTTMHVIINVILVCKLDHFLFLLDTILYGHGFLSRDVCSVTEVWI